jgi:D-alanyl-D-alanine carboxypeptidase/D-alanyl-D-alanine-endopeptidase (penicillin-binding protein 4)
MTIYRQAAMKYPNDGLELRKDIDFTRFYLTMILKNLMPNRLRKFPAYPILLIIVMVVACNTQKKTVIEKESPAFLQKPVFNNANVGLAVFDPATQQWLYAYQDTKYFVPASNTKLFSLYAGLKYLGDSLTTFSWQETDSALYILPFGDPTFLHPDFSNQPSFQFLRSKNKKIFIIDTNWKDQSWGAGWSWDDYNDDYMVERSSFPIYGNIIRWIQENQQPDSLSLSSSSNIFVYSLPEVNWKIRFNPDSSTAHFFVKRKLAENIFEITQGLEKKAEQAVPFVTNGLQSAFSLLEDTLGPGFKVGQPSTHDLTILSQGKRLSSGLLRSRPVDSLYRPLMFRSDNFFAEQVLLMASQQRMGFMNDDSIINQLLNNELAGLPQRPHWVDGSGLSRYNLFSPRDFVWILDQMKNEFGLERMERLLPTGGKGTLRNYYKQDSGYIFAKTGSLSDVITLSGYLITKKNRLLIFSILVNNYLGKGFELRRETEQFLHGIRETN